MTLLSSVIGPNCEAKRAASISTIASHPCRIHSATGSRAKKKQATMPRALDSAASTAQSVMYASKAHRLNCPSRGAAVTKSDCTAVSF
jgi:hypothetical protein